MGDFNGDGRQDVAIHNSGTGVVYVYVTAASIPDGAGVNVNAAESAALTTLPAGAVVMGVGDFNGDGRADVLVQDASGNLVALVSDAGVTPGNPVGLDATKTGFITNPPAGWSVLSVADADGDGNADVYVGHTDGSVYTYITILNAGTPNANPAASGAPVSAPAGWTINTVGDMNGDGRSDMVAANSVLSGTMGHQLYTFITAVGGISVDGAASGTSGEYPDGYVCCVAGEFTPATDSNDLGIVGAATNPGLTYIYAMGADGFTVDAGSSAANVTLPANWEAAGLGDFNNDGIADLLANNTATGGLLVFLASGPGGVSGSPFLTNLPGGWTTAQFQGMGVTD
jgi:hypothetical protein